MIVLIKNIITKGKSPKKDIIVQSYLFFPIKILDLRRGIYRENYTRVWYKNKNEFGFGSDNTTPKAECYLTQNQTISYFCITVECGFIFITKLSTFLLSYNNQMAVIGMKVSVYCCFKALSLWRHNHKFKIPLNRFKYLCRYNSN